MSHYPVKPLTHPIDARVNIPGSKSLTNRALLTAALSKGSSRLNNVLHADDTRIMADALRSLGIAVRFDNQRRTAHVHGCSGLLPNTQADLYCQNAGTVIRFLTAACATAHGNYRLDGSARMRQRPIEELVRALQSLGAKIRYEHAHGYPPIAILTGGLQGGQVQFDAPRSSQMVSAILLAAPAAQNDVFVSIEGQRHSTPYIAMTLAVMKAFGIEFVEQDMRKFIVPAPQSYRACDFTIEPDASNSSYFLAAAAITSGRVTIPGLSPQCLQGDIAFADILQRMGCQIEWSDAGLTVQGPPADRPLIGIDADLNDTPDLAQTLAVTALFAHGPTRIRNVANLRIKETDRLAALQTELAKIGARVSTDEQSLTVTPPQTPRPAAIDTYDDHRMAMSFAIAGLAIEGIVIRDPQCTTKTFPTFFDTLERLSESPK